MKMAALIITRKSDRSDRLRIEMRGYWKIVKSNTPFPHPTIITIWMVIWKVVRIIIPTPLIYQMDIKLCKMMVLLRLLVWKWMEIVRRMVVVVLMKRKIAFLSQNPKRCHLASPITANPKQCKTPTCTIPSITGL